MGIQTDKLNRSFTAFIEKQTLFFVATAAQDGRVNLSPKAVVGQFEICVHRFRDYML